ncbi:uncharacterized protein LOC103570447 [Microplitis demolitor]|uniref:uncharacterized protein LOC103570447 n=1 Tax=Microplitis demolitor TaxID=69319 RepID=UPI0004CCAA26|nr:uncharacterized protein LOC103570447 [Microplitis demolitor]
MSENSDTLAKDLIASIMINVNNSISCQEQETEKLTGSNSNTSISEILQKVAELAEGLCNDLQGVQIGDYVISMNKSPLEIQVKQAIENYKDGKEVKVLIKGQGDGVENIPLPGEVVSLTPVTPVTPEGLHAEPNVTENDLSTLKRKKNLSLARRIWRILRFTFNRRKN